VIVIRCKAPDSGIGIPLSIGSSRKAESYCSIRCGSKDSIGDEQEVWPVRNKNEDICKREGKIEPTMINICSRVFESTPLCKSGILCSRCNHISDSQTCPLQIKSDFANSPNNIRISARGFPSQDTRGTTIVDRNKGSISIA
jgi:hypothetical protein